jgi:hypothetical protein
LDLLLRRCSLIQYTIRSVRAMKIFATLFSLPPMILFYVAWIVSSIAKPLIVVSLVVSIALNPSAAFRKFHLLVTTVRYLLFCKDKKWKVPEQDANADACFASDTANSSGTASPSEPQPKIERKTIIFVRHGESTWNDTFNRGDRPMIGFVLNFVPNLIKAIAAEWFFWVILQASNESWFYDSPLSEKGLSQAIGLRRFLQTDTEYSPPNEADLILRLRGDRGAPKATGVVNGVAASAGSKEQTGSTSGPSSQLVSSNLRRAVSTMIVGFQDRLAKNCEGDNILVLPCLQEISINPDALSITPANSPLSPAWTDPRNLRFYYHKGGRIDTSKNSGNKAVSSNGYQRMQEFCKIVFDDISKETIIACGHSLWFKSFFQTYLPRECDHISKRKKLVNGGTVGFTLERTRVGTGDDQRWVYRIDPKHIVVLYGGF